MHLLNGSMRASEHVEWQGIVGTYFGGKRLCQLERDANAHVLCLCLTAPSSQSYRLGPLFRHPLQCGFHTLGMPLDGPVMFCVPARDPSTSSTYFFLRVPIKVYTLCWEVLWVLTRAYYLVFTIAFKTVSRAPSLTPKINRVSSSQPSPTPPQTLGNH